MTEEFQKLFNEKCNTSLSHPLFPFRLTRLQLALMHIIEATGAAGEKAFLEHCASRDEDDKKMGKTDEYEVPDEG